MSRIAEKVRMQMLGEKAFKLMNDGGDFDPSTECPASEELVRKEFQRETDVAYQMRMFGVGQAFQRRGVSGSVDYDVDRLSALAILEDASFLWKKLPVNVREKYKDWGEVEAAAMDGSLADLFKPAEVPKEEPKV